MLSVACLINCSPIRQGGGLSGLHHQFHSCHTETSLLIVPELCEFQGDSAALFSPRRLENFENAWKMMKLTRGQFWIEKNDSGHKN